MQTLRGAASPYLRPGRGPLQRPAPTADSRSPFLVQWPVVTQLSRAPPGWRPDPAATPRRGTTRPPSLFARARRPLVTRSSRRNSLCNAVAPYLTRGAASFRPDSPTAPPVQTRFIAGPSRPDPPRDHLVPTRLPAGPPRDPPRDHAVSNRLPRASPGPDSTPPAPPRPDPSPPPDSSPRAVARAATRGTLRNSSSHARPNPQPPPQLPVAPAHRRSTSTTPAPSYESLSRPMHAELAPAPVRATSGVWSSCQRVPPRRPRPARAERHPAATSYVERAARRPRVGRRSAVLQTDSVEHAPGPPLRVGPRPGRRRDGPGVRAAAVRAPRPLVIHPLARGAFGHLLAGAPLMCLCAIHRHMNRRPGCACRSTAPDAPGAITHAFRPLACLAFHVEQSPSNRRERASVPRRGLPSPGHVRCVDPQRAAKVTQRPGPGLVPPGLTRVSARSDQTHS